MQNIRSIIINNAKLLLMAIFVTYSLFAYLFYVGDISGWIKNPIGVDLIWLFIAAVLFYVFRKSLEYKVYLNKWPIYFLSIFFSVIVTLGRSMTLNGNFEMYVSKFGLLIFLLIILGFTILFVMLLNFIFKQIDEFQNSGTKIQIFESKRNTLLIIWIAIAFVYSIYLFLLFPGTISYDSIIEMNQYKSGQYSDHHPFGHVLLVFLMMKISEIFGGNLIGAIFLYSLFQMLVMSAIFAYSIKFLIERQVNKYIIVFVFLFFAILPVHAVYSITLWKDVLFSGVCLLISIHLLKLIYDHQKVNFRFYLFLGFYLFLFCILRHNGFYAFVLSIPFFILMLKGKRKSIALLCFSVLGAVLIYSKLLLPNLGVKKGSMGESLSIPLQQIARTVKDHESTLTPSEKETINKLFGTDSIGILYKPNISDPVKSRFNQVEFKEDSKRYTSLWFELLKKYPLSYFESFFAGSYGYFDPNLSYGGGYIFTTIYDFDYTGFTFSSPNQKDVNSVKKMSSILKISKFLLVRIPIISLLTSIGFMIWIGLIVITYCFLNRRYLGLIPFILLSTLFLTLIASPVNADYRYAYGLMISIPFVSITVLTEEKRRKRLNNSSLNKFDNIEIK